MDIFFEEPKDWTDLQDKVAYILKSCGYFVESPKKIQSVRGNVEIDVYANNSDIMIACECKYWESNVPQNVIFAFRTVVEDIGANKGIIIAKKGFQRGAYNSIQNTNIELKSWEEFLKQYRDKYLKSNIRKILKIKSKLFRVARNKFEYWEYYDALNDSDRSKIDTLRDELLRIVLQFTPMCVMIQNEEDEEIGWDIEYVNKIILDAEKVFTRDFLSYFDFFEYMNEQICDIVSRIEFIYGNKIL